MSTPPPLPLLHSCLGIASFVLSLVALTGFVFIIIIFVAGKISTLIILIMACIIIAMMWLLTLGHFYPSLKDLGIPEITFVEPWMLITTGVLLIMALGLGVAGLMQPECKKVFSVLGCVFSISGLLTIFGIHQMLN